MGGQVRPQREATLFETIGLWIELEHGVERDTHVRDLFGITAQQIAINGPQDGLMADHQDRPLLALELEHHGLYALDHIHVALPARIAVAELVARTCLPVLR